jgi:hypothetical protein
LADALKGAVPDSSDNIATRHDWLLREKKLVISDPATRVCSVVYSLHNDCFLLKPLPDMNDEATIKTPKPPRVSRTPKLKITPKQRQRDTSTSDVGDVPSVKRAKVCFNFFSIQTSLFCLGSCFEHR